MLKCYYRCCFENSTSQSNSQTCRPVTNRNCRIRLRSRGDNRRRNIRRRSHHRIRRHSIRHRRTDNRHRSNHRGTQFRSRKRDTRHRSSYRILRHNRRRSSHHRNIRRHSPSRGNLPGLWTLNRPLPLLRLSLRSSETFSWPLASPQDALLWCFHLDGRTPVVVVMLGQPAGLTIDNLATAMPIDQTELQLLQFGLFLRVFRESSTKPTRRGIWPDCSISTTRDIKLITELRRMAGGEIHDRVRDLVRPQRLMSSNRDEIRVRWLSNGLRDAQLERGNRSCVNPPRTSCRPVNDSSKPALQVCVDWPQPQGVKKLPRIAEAVLVFVTQRYELSTGSGLACRGLRPGSRCTRIAWQSGSST